jgi:hypothetical protein
LTQIEAMRDDDALSQLPSRPSGVPVCCRLTLGPSGSWTSLEARPGSEGDGQKFHGRDLIAFFGEREIDDYRIPLAGEPNSLA